jgi:hypothetical protein
LLAIAVQPRIIKIILYGVLEGSNGEPLLVLRQMYRAAICDIYCCASDRYYVIIWCHII